MISNHSEAIKIIISHSFNWFNVMHMQHNLASVIFIDIKCTKFTCVIWIHFLNFGHIYANIYGIQWVLLVITSWLQLAFIIHLECVSTIIVPKIRARNIQITMNKWARTMHISLYGWRSMVRLACLTTIQFPSFEQCMQWPECSISRITFFKGTIITLNTTQNMFVSTVVYWVYLQF